MAHFMHSWRGSNTTIINNNYFRIGIPHCRPRPRFFGGCRGGGINMFGMFNGFLAGRMFMGGMSNLFGLGKQYNTLPSYSNSGYSPYRSENGSKSCSCPDLTDEIKNLSDQVANLESEIAELKKHEQKEIKISDDEKDEVKGKDAVDEKGDKDSKVKKDESNDDSEKIDDEADKKEVKQDAGTIAKKGSKDFDETADKVINALDKNLDNSQKSYIKDKITEIYRDDDGNIKYNITAITHDADTSSEIAKRFYKDGEEPDFSVGNANFNTQQSENNIITNPHSGNTITLNGISSYGLNALMQDAKDGVTRQGEIAKTNKRIAQLKEEFKSGNKNLSWAYVKQNNIMDKAEYDKIVSEKYNK